jgi:beta-mannanase
MKPAIATLGLVAATALVVASTGSAATTTTTRIGILNIEPSEVSKYNRYLNPNRVTMIGAFISWGNGADPGRYIRRIRKAGYIPVITWEPWRVRANGTNTGGKFDPKYSNARIASGKWDAWIKVWAKEMRGTKPVYLRYAHEANGYWYAWHHDPKSYIKAWRRVRTIFRHYAPNVKFVWSMNSNWTMTGWKASVMPYWPGLKYVDYVGITAIESYSAKNPTVYIDNLRLLHSMFPSKPMAIPELNVQTVAFANALKTYLATAPWVKFVNFLEHDKFPSLLTEPDVLKVFA